MSDVCLLLEGTFPYITGGVSSCVYRMIKSTPNISYTVVFIGANKDPLLKYKYEIPDNVVHIQEIYLYDQKVKPELITLGRKINRKKIIEIFKNPFENQIKNFDFLYNHLFNETSRVCSPYEFINSKEVWDILSELYPKKPPYPSFVDYFYTFRFSQLPIIKILQAKLPKARLYHALCTGYGAR